MLVTYHMMFICSKVCIHRIRLAKISELAIENKPLIYVQKFVSILSDIASIVSDEEYCDTDIFVKSLEHLKE